jgi:hypothetical protein
MSSSSAAVAPAAAVALPGLLPPRVQIHRSVVIIAEGGRDLGQAHESALKEADPDAM